MTRRVGGVAAVLGGVVWTVHATALAVRPTGCVRESCTLPGAVSRPSEDLAPVFLLAVVLLAVAATASSLGREQAGRPLVRAGAALLWAGAALLLLGLAVNAVLPGDSPLWWLHDTDSLGRLVPVAGSFLVGLGLWRRPGSSWIGVLLAGAALVSVPFNAQDARVALTIPLGAAWAVAGLWSLLRRRPAGTAPPPADPCPATARHAPSERTGGPAR